MAVVLPGVLLKRRVAWAVGLALWAGWGVARAAVLSGEVRDGAGQPLAEVVILARPAPPVPPRPPLTVVIDQRDREFIPHVLAIQRGDAVDFPNSDNIQHHVYSFSPGNAFEIKLYKGRPERPIRFGQPGVAVLGCNIHDWMLGYVYVADTPYFAVSDAGGRWSLPVPAGEYRLAAWQPDAERDGELPGPAVMAAEGTPVGWNPVIPLKRLRRGGKPPAHPQQEAYPGEP